KGGHGQQEAHVPVNAVQGVQEVPRLALGERPPGLRGDLSAAIAPALGDALIEPRVIGRDEALPAHEPPELDVARQDGVDGAGPGAAWRYGLLDEGGSGPAVDLADLSVTGEQQPDVGPVRLL